MGKSCSKKNSVTQLICSPPSSVEIPTFGTTEIPLEIPAIDVASLNIDTSLFEDPCIQLEVSLNVTPIALVDLQVQVVRQCANQPPINVGSAYRFVSDTGSDTISFHVCDRDLCDQGCCTYFIRITNSFIIAGPLTLRNITLSALIVDPCNCKC